MFFDRPELKSKSIYPQVFPQDLDEVVQSAVQLERSPQGTIEALKRLWPTLAKNRGRSQDEHYSFKSEEARAYAAYYLPANVLKIVSILEEVRMSGLWDFEKDFGKAPEASLEIHWWDYGSGPGTLPLGLAWWWQKLGLKNTLHLTAVDQSNLFLKTAEVLIRKFLRSAPIQFKTKKTSIVAALGEFERSFAAARSGVYVASFLNSIGELAETGEIGKWIERLAAQNKKNSGENPQKKLWLFVVEPGSKISSRGLLELREQIRGFEGVSIRLPCLGNRACGALMNVNDWCHEEAVCRFPAWHNELGAGAGLHKESLLFSYLVLEIGGVNKGREWPTSAVRMVSQRMQEKGLLQCFVCTESGKKKARILNSVGEGMTDRRFFEAVRGEVFQSMDLDEKGNVKELGSYCFSETSIKSPIITES